LALFSPSYASTTYGIFFVFICFIDWERFRSIVWCYCFASQSSMFLVVIISNYCLVSVPFLYLISFELLWFALLCLLHHFGAWFVFFFTFLLLFHHVFCTLSYFIADRYSWMIDDDISLPREFSYRFVVGERILLFLIWFLILLQTRVSFVCLPFLFFYFAWNDSFTWKTFIKQNKDTYKNTCTQLIDYFWLVY
jgi:hypothetical protein